jgi:hypothetical protein
LEKRFDLGCGKGSLHFVVEVDVNAATWWRGRWWYGLHWSGNLPLLGGNSGYAHYKQKPKKAKKEADPKKLPRSVTL